MRSYEETQNLIWEEYKKIMNEFTPKEPLHSVINKINSRYDLIHCLDFYRNKPEAKFFKTKLYRHENELYLLCAWSECEWSLNQYMKMLTDELPDRF